MHVSIFSKYSWGARSAQRPSLAGLEGMPLLNVRQRKRLLAHVARERRERQRAASARHFGSQTWVQQQPGAHDGPITPSQFINYPLDILHAVKSQGLWEMTDSLGQARMARLLAILNCPLVIHTDYTGKRTAETCFHLYKPALELMEIPCDVEVCIWRNCDIDKVCTQLALKSIWPPLHQFKELNTRIDEKTLTTLSSLRPKKNASKAKKCNAYAKMATAIEKKAVSFNRQTRAPCLRHPGMLCPIACMPLVEPIWERRPISIYWAGASCLPFTKWGSHEGHSHPDIEAWYIWISEMQQMGYDLIFLEESAQFDPTLFSIPMQKKATL